jgi:hypothetical protein
MKGALLFTVFIGVATFVRAQNANGFTIKLYTNDKRDWVFMPDRQCLSYGDTVVARSSEDKMIIERIDLWKIFLKLRRWNEP